MLEDLGTSWLVHVAMFAYVLGFLFREQITLRLLVLIGTGFYIAYYYVQTPAPLWDAIFASVAIGTANLIGMGRLLYSRYVLLIPTEQRGIFGAMSGLQPGEFRKLMRLGEIKTADKDFEMTVEGTPPDHLYYVVDGTPRATKNGQSFSVRDEMFIGEISFILHRAASACVTLPAGSTYVQWNKAALRHAMARDPQFGQALEALISRDMARKVAESVHVDSIFPSVLEDDRSTGRSTGVRAVAALS